MTLDFNIHAVRAGAKQFLATPLITEIPGVPEGFNAELKMDSEYLGDMRPNDGTDFFFPGDPSGPL